MPTADAPVPAVCPQAPGGSGATCQVPDNPPPASATPSPDPAGQKRRGNPNLGLAPRCGARTRAGCPCRAPAISGRLRCRMHGGRSTGPRSAEGMARLRTARTLHGGYSAEARGWDRHMCTLERRIRVANDAVRFADRLPPDLADRLLTLPPELSPPPFSIRGLTRAEDRAVAQAEAASLAPWRQAIADLRQGRRQVAALSGLGADDRACGTEAHAPARGPAPSEAMPAVENLMHQSRGLLRPRRYVRSRLALRAAVRQNLMHHQSGDRLRPRRWLRSRQALQAAVRQNLMHQRGGLLRPRRCVRSRLALRAAVRQNLMHQRGGLLRPRRCVRSRQALRAAVRQNLLHQRGGLLRPRRCVRSRQALRAAVRQNLLHQRGGLLRPRRRLRSRQALKATMRQNLMHQRGGLLRLRRCLRSRQALQAAVWQNLLHQSGGLLRPRRRVRSRQALQATMRQNLMHQRGDRLCPRRCLQSRQALQAAVWQDSMHQMRPQAVQPPDRTRRRSPLRKPRSSSPPTPGPLHGPTLQGEGKWMPRSREGAGTAWRTQQDPLHQNRPLPHAAIGPSMRRGKLPPAAPGTTCWPAQAAMVWGRSRPSPAAGT